MSTSIIMPQLGESVAEGVIGKWLKNEGDQIQRDEPIVEVITDKVNAEIPSPLAGVLEKITQPEGATVAVGEEIGIIGDGSARVEQVVEPAAVPTEVGVSVEGRTPTASQLAGGDGQEATSRPEPMPVAESAAHTSDVPTASVLAPATERGTNGATRESNGRGNRVRSSPLVRRLAEEHNIDLADVPGTGIGGRVSKQDILAFVAQAESAPAAPTPFSMPSDLSEQPTAARVTEGAPRAPSGSSQSATSQPSLPAQPVAFREAGPTEELIPVSPVRKMIANRMAQSVYTIPHATTIVEVDMTNVVRFREANKAEFQNREGTPLSVVAFVIKATVEALKEWPMVNAEWGGDNIILKKEININCAVDAPEGLTTPVIHHADEKSLAGLSKAIYDLAMRARNKRLKIEDMQGGTFTVNNTGALGSVWSMSIINYPQGGIISGAAIVKRPVVMEQDGQDSIAIRSMMNMSLAFDHRLLDGGYAASFLGAVKNKLESWHMEYPLY